MPRRRGRDDERVDTGLDERLGRLRGADAELGREPVRAGRVRVGDRERRHCVEVLQGPDVNEADPTDPDDAYMEPPTTGRKIPLGWSGS